MIDTLSVLAGLWLVRILIHGSICRFAIKIIQSSKRAVCAGITDAVTMLRFVRHKGTRSYWSKDGVWTGEASAAQHFDSIQTVLHIQRQLKLREIEIVLQVGSEPSEEYDIALPLRDPFT